MTVRIFVPDLPEFEAVVNAARNAGNCSIIAPIAGHWRIEADKAIRFERKLLRLGPALWNSALTGGYQGRIVEYSRDVLLIEGEG